MLGTICWNVFTSPLRNWQVTSPILCLGRMCYLVLILVVMNMIYRELLSEGAKAVIILNMVTLTVLLCRLVVLLRLVTVRTPLYWWRLNRLTCLKKNMARCRLIDCVAERNLLKLVRSLLRMCRRLRVNVRRPHVACNSVVLMVLLLLVPVPLPRVLVVVLLIHGSVTLVNILILVRNRR